MASTIRYQILLCEGPTCGGCHASEELRTPLNAALERGDLKSRVSLQRYLCFGRCSEGPNLVVRPLREDQSLKGVPPMQDLEDNCLFYGDLDDDMVEKIVLEHCGKGKPLDDAEPY